MTTRCTYHDCEHEAEFQCALCQQDFCAFHTREQSAYPFQLHTLCETHYEEEVLLLSQPQPLELWGLDDVPLFHRVNGWFKRKG